jgi:phenylalanyl-tRNA synthetase alpha subunit
MHSLFLNNIQHVIYRTLSISQVFNPNDPVSRLPYKGSLDPAVALDPPPDLYEKVSTVHSVGGNGSTGYRAPFSRTESTRLLLRTHTTACSTNMLHRISNQPGGFRPVKMFSIDRVFRNETMDATHLAEFHQVEGVVADRGLTLGDLIGNGCCTLLCGYHQ